MSVMETVQPVAHDLAPQFASFDIDAHQVPTGREEAWRFAAMSSLRQFFEADPAAGAVSGVSDSPLVVNQPADSQLVGWVPTDRAAAVARAGARTVVRVDIPAEHVSVEPVVVRLQADAPVAYQHVELRAGFASEAVVVIEPVADADVTGAITIDVADSARLTVVIIASCGAEQRMLAHVPAVVGRDAALTVATVAMGGKVVRLQPSVRFSAPGGSATVLGAFLVQGASRLEQRVFIDHDQPHCTSRVAYKGALSGAGARSTWIGDVLVRRDAVGTDTYELNRNLLLDDGPRADSVPNLELETGDVVGAGHASATGRFDDEQLFYLQARGIPEEIARQLVVRGFFADVLNALPTPELRQAVDHQISARLGLPEATDD